VSFITEALIAAINGFLIAAINDILAFFSGTVAREHEMAVRLLDSAFVVGAIQITQAVAGSLLALKISVEVLRSYIFFGTGNPDANPAKLVKRAMYAAGMIAAGPWLARSIFGYGASLAIAVSQMPLVGADAHPLAALATRPVNVGMGFILALGAMVVFWLLIYIQTIIRSVEVAFLAVAGPIMAVGLTGQDEGVWAVWWRELIVVALSQAVQMFMLTGFFATLGHSMTQPGFTMDHFSMLTAIAWLWVAHKSPAVLKQFAYHTGAGSLTTTAARTGSSLIKMIALKK